MSSKSLNFIEEKYSVNPPISVNKIERFISSLRKDDVVSSTLFARKCKLSQELSKQILMDLVGQGILDYFILVPCSNHMENTEHYMTFSALEEVNDHMKANPLCPICNDVEAKIHYDKMKIGFKRHES